MYERCTKICLYPQIDEIDDNGEIGEIGKFGNERDDSWRLCLHMERKLNVIVNDVGGKLVSRCQKAIVDDLSSRPGLTSPVRGFWMCMAAV